MDFRYIACTTRHPLFYDLPWADASAMPKPLAPLIGNLPEGWSTTTRDPWTIITAATPMPASGWKIHIASRPDEVEQVLPLIAEYCLDTDTSFKFLSSTALVKATQSKYADLVAAGKVIVAYPTTELATQHMVEHLRVPLSRFRGARIVGDIPVIGTPMGLRFGAYLHSWTKDDSGRLVPAVHTPHGTIYDDRRSHTPSGPEPGFICELRRQAALNDEAELLPLTDVTLLHRSNAGGVYRACWDNSSKVIVKEARHHTGYDANGIDAPTRLAHEYAVLQRLAHTGHTPRPYQLLTVGPSDFLIMEDVQGNTCQRIAASVHPLVRPGATAQELDDYFSLCEQIAKAGHKALTTLHKHGVTHGDVMPANVIWDNHRIVFIDLESASLDGKRIAEGIGTPGFQVLPPGTPQADHAAWQIVSAFLVRPETKFAPTDKAIRAQVHADTLQVLNSSNPITGNDHATMADQLWNGIEWSSHHMVRQTPRLIPGDIAGVLEPGAASGILHGASGVLLAAQATSRSIPAAWLDWIDEQIPHIPPLADGFADGRAGIALTLALHNRPSAAQLAWPEPLQPSPVPWWRRGTAGHLLAAAELWTATDDVVWRSRLVQAWAQTKSLVTSQDTPAGWVPGLLDGWCGVSLALLRSAELVGQKALPEITADELRWLARIALDRELGCLTRHGSGTMLMSGGIGWPYLSNGTAALAWASKVLESEGLLDEVVDLESCRATLAVPLTMGVSLLRGRAGLIAALDLISPDDPEVRHHQDRIRWHIVTAEEIEQPGRPGPTRVLGESLPLELIPPPGVMLCPGELGLRYSADLATGSAGVVAALAPHPARAVAQSLRLPLPR